MGSKTIIIEIHIYINSFQVLGNQLYNYSDSNPPTTNNGKQNDWQQVIVALEISIKLNMREDRDSKDNGDQNLSLQCTEFWILKPIYK